METRRWVNPQQPQTLYIAQLLMYFRGGLALVFGALFGWSLSVLSLLFALGNVAAAFGIANERRWGYKLGVSVSALTLVLSLLVLMRNFDRLWGDAVGLMFDVALVALLLHPISRNYQRYWPKKTRG